MKLGIINSAYQQVGIGTVTGLNHIARLGFDAVDIFTEAVGLSKKEVSLVAKTTEKLGLPIISLPVVALGLIDFNEPVREFHIERCQKFIDLAHTWDARNILLVLGEYIWQREVIAPSAQWQWGLEACRRLGDYAGQKENRYRPGTGTVSPQPAEQRVGNGAFRGRLRSPSGQSQY